MLARGTILGAIGLLSAVLIFRKNTEVDNCDFDFVCSRCRKVKQCDLPEAIQYKKKEA